jgi:hypothetical protein
VSKQLNWTTRYAVLTPDGRTIGRFGVRDDAHYFALKMHQDRGGVWRTLDTHTGEELAAIGGE